MCGIFGYIGRDKNAYSTSSGQAAQIVIGGLKRLEYRGYDSWGVAVLEKGRIKTSKKVGAIGDLNESLGLPDSFIGIGHTRWATHGGISETNAHPHYSSDKSFALAHNGIVENYLELKDYLLKKGAKFETETDTEVIVRMIEDKHRGSTPKGVRPLKEAVRAAFLELRGRNTIILLDKNDEIIACRNGSPLVVGLSDDEVYLSSDTLSFAPYAKKMIVVENGQMVVCKEGKVELFNVKSGKIIKYKLENVDLEDNLIDKEGYPHFMLKEINEEPYVIHQLISQDKKALNVFVQAIKKAKNVYTIASGTTGIAASQIAFYLREHAKIRATSLIGAEALEYLDLFTKDDLLIAPSQSGETADVLEILEKAKKKRVKIASFVNMQGSTMSRMSDFKFMTQAGPEVCVMSTKVFVSQIAWGYLIAKATLGKLDEGIKKLKLLSFEMEKYLNDERSLETIKKLAKHLLGKKDIFLLGKFQNLNIIREGMVKLIEGTYKHAHAMPSGDLKHYAITLMEEGVPVIVAVSNDEAKFDVLNAVNEVKARGAEVIGISPFSNQGFKYHLKVSDCGEVSAIMNVVPLQLLAYYMTVELGHNVDKPRNIAKSVTVK